jgi:hypothetical protein
MAVLSASSMAAATTAEPPRDIGDRRQFFIDQRFLTAARGISLEVKTPVKRGIVLQADDPKRTFIGQYGSVLEHDGVFHMWYQACTIAGEAGRNDGAEGRGYISYARSVDGVIWTKPKLGFVAGAHRCLHPGEPYGAVGFVMRDTDLYAFQFRGKQ